VFSSDFTFENYEYASINKPTTFSIKPKVNSAFNADLHFDIITPSGQPLQAKIEEQSMNTYIMRCLPNEIGNHEIIFYRDRHKQNRMIKFVCQVYDASQVRVSELPSIIAHQSCRFTGSLYSIDIS
jgi:hypothetical protein